MMEPQDLIPITRICQHHQIDLAFFSALEEYELIEVVTLENTVCVRSEDLSEIERMIRLHYELQINLEGIDAIRHLVQRVEQMNLELNHLRNRLRRYEE